MSVYPRWRGEHNFTSSAVGVILGLSPLARGTLRMYTGRPWVWRFIPAGAGNTLNSPLRVFANTVYPRWRGEHTTAPLIWLTDSGLSPLARGTLFLHSRVHLVRRFIPAGAGNTFSRRG